VFVVFLIAEVVYLSVRIVSEKILKSKVSLKDFLGKAGSITRNLFGSVMLNGRDSNNAGRAKLARNCVK